MVTRFVEMSEDWSNIKVLGGVSDSGGSYLSTEDYGSYVYMSKEDDGSGRQRWVLDKGRGGVYHIKIAGGVESFGDGFEVPVFLSAEKDGSGVWLSAEDDRSGRQRWVITKGSGDWHYIEVLRGVSGGKTLLSAEADSSHVYLSEEDDGSGRQRWAIPSLDGGLAVTTSTSASSAASAEPLELPDSRFDPCCDTSNGTHGVETMRKAPGRSWNDFWDCERFGADPGMCFKSADLHDDEDFTAMDMCCACGGGGKCPTTTTTTTTTTSAATSTTTTTTTAATTTEAAEVEEEKPAAEGWHIIRSLGGVSGGMYLSTEDDGSYVFMHTEDDGSGRQRWVLTKGDSGEWYHIKIAGGVTGYGMGDGEFLSAEKDGSALYLTTKDDGSGRQRWVVAKGSGEWFHLKVLGGVPDDSVYLSVEEGGSHAYLGADDDGSGRQRWLIPSFEGGLAEATTTTTTTSATASPTSTTARHRRPRRRRERRTSATTTSSTTTSTTSTSTTTFEEGWHSIRAFGSSASGGGEYLSAEVDGSNVHMHAEDDASGLQRWVLVEGDGAWYHIKAAGGVSGFDGGAYLSAQEDGSQLLLRAEDDGSGRQRWVVTKGSGDWFHIRVLDGVSGGSAYLSMDEDGSHVYLEEGDDGSGRQRWTIPSFEGGEAVDWHNIQGLGGNEFLSTEADGSHVYMHAEDDASGRQRWVLTKGHGEWYYIKAVGGVSGNGYYLSAEEDGSGVHLHPSDDGSGRQRWDVTKGSGDYFVIKVIGGVSGDGLYLSMDKDGSHVHLQADDDGSGRQHWAIPAFEGGLTQDWHSIKVLGGSSYLSSEDDGSNMYMHDKDDASGRQRWVLSKGDGEDWYHIKIVGGVSGFESGAYLSAAEDGSSLRLSAEDDRSGRQRWVVTRGSGEWFNIKVLGGVSGDSSYLCMDEDGSHVYLDTEDDGSGRQRWVIPSFEGGWAEVWYNIQVEGGASGGARYLGTEEDGSLVYMHMKDDSSGRQRWVLTQGSGQWYHIKVVGGVSGSGVYLGAAEDGSSVRLDAADDGSGRQRWVVVEGSGWFNIKVFGGVSGGSTYLSVDQDGSSVYLHSEDDGGGLQRWVIPLFTGGFPEATPDGLPPVEPKEGPFELPKLDWPYNPIELLCGRRELSENGTLEWCGDWLGCVYHFAERSGEKGGSEDAEEKVMEAWKPADCREYCGEWPVIPSFLSTGAGGAAAAKGRGDCIKSCESFQHQLSSCVGTILFAPGQVVNMGMPEKEGTRGDLPAICTDPRTPCQPDLVYEHQKCVRHRARKFLGRKWSEAREQQCIQIQLDVEDCDGCPQLLGDYPSSYYHFVGGCMDQLHAYWAATHPRASRTAGARVPDAAGCPIH